MQRRYFLSVASLAMVGLTGLVVLAGTQALAQPRTTVSAAQLQHMVAQRFPLRYPVAGVLNMDVQAPLLRLLPQQNRLSAEMVVDASGPALNTSRQGTLEVDFTLRYEASDRTVRAHQLRFKQLRIADLSPAGNDLLNLYGPALAQQALQEVVLHQLRPQDLALTDDLGLQPASITVTDNGLVVGFEMKPLK
jgi:hypothetical protein